MFISDPHISSNKLECVKKNNRNEINSVDDHRVWLCIRVTFSSSSGKVFGLPSDWFSLVVGCGSTLARVLPNMPQSSLMATAQLLHVSVCWGLTSLVNN